MQTSILMYLKFVKKRLLQYVLFLKRKKILTPRIPQILLGYDYQVLRFESFENIEKQKIIFKYSYNDLLAYCPPIYDKFIDHAMVSCDFQTSYSAMFNEVEVIGGSNLIILDRERAILDVECKDFNNKIYYTDLGIRCYKNKNILIKKIFCENDIESGIFVGGNFSWNYFHLLFEIYIKFSRLIELKIDKEIPILVDQVCIETPQYFEILKLLNYENRPILPLQTGIRYKVKRLIHISSPHLIPPDLIDPIKLQAHDVLLDLKALKYIRETLLLSASKTCFPEKIFISRSKASGRRSYNEDEVFNLLEKYNFVKVYPEDYSIKDQISLFNGASFIIGGAGAAFTNLIFCSANCKIIAFAKNRIPFSGFSTIAKFVNAKMLYITESGKGSTGIHDSYVIDINKLNKILLTWQ